MRQRHLTLAGVVNFRDFGDYPTRNGRRVLAGKLFRSAHFNAATDGDAAQLDGLGVSFLVDLRQRHERDAQPNRWAPARTVFHDPEPPGAPPPEIVGAYTAEVGCAAMRAAYERYPYEARFISLFADLFAGLADEGGPVVVHCAAGKDRTGIACALVLDALGVDRAIIFDDYLATNATLDRVARARLVRARLEPRVGAPLSDEAIAPMIGVEAGYLQASLDVIAAHSGSIANYLATTLGFDTERLGRLRERLLA
jgi:protein-tyrosine phosphatase